MKPAATWLFRLALLGMSLGISLAIGEIAVRIVSPQDLSIWDNTRDGITIHRVNADVYLPSFQQRIQTNNLGMRDQDHGPQKPPSVARIFTFGDSFLEAVQVTYDQSFPALLEDRLFEDSSPVETVSLAVSGWGTDDQVTYLERHGLALDPDGILIMMTLHNDVNDNGQLEFHSLSDSGLVPRPPTFMPWPRFLLQKGKAHIAGISHLYRLAHHTWVRENVRRGGIQLDHHVSNLIRRDSSPELEDQWALTLALLDKAKGLAAGRGAWLAVGLIPLAIQVDDAQFTAFLEAHHLEADDVDRDAPQRRVREWGVKRGVEVIDLLPAFRAHAHRNSETHYLPNDGHWSRAGHALAAEEVAMELRRRGIVQKAP